MYHLQVECQTNMTISEPLHSTKLKTFFYNPETFQNRTLFGKRIYSY